MSYSDYDKFKDKKKKKTFFSKERDDNPGSSGKQTIILAKPERDKECEKDKADRSSQQTVTTESSSKSSSQTTFILKTRDNDSRAVSPCQIKPPVVLRKENDIPATSYQIATKPATAEASPLQLPPTMSSCVKLVDDSLQICDHVSEFLIDQNDFIVVGVLGEQSSGKSYIMSALSAKPGIFKSQPKEVSENSGQCTYGIDVFITPSRLMLLDVQPVLSTSSAERVLVQDKKYTGEFTPNDTSADVTSMQLAAFLLSVCHVVLVLQDWAGDNDFTRSLLDAEMLKPSTTTTLSGNELIEYFPHVVFIKNRASSTEFTPAEIDRIQESMKNTLAGSQLHIESGLSISTGLVMPQLAPSTCKESLNLYLLPMDDDKEKCDKFRGHPGFTELIKCLHIQILSAPRHSITPTPISEKHWFHYAAKTLENVKKSSLFMEFGRFLP